MKTFVSIESVRMDIDTRLELSVQVLQEGGREQVAQVSLPFAAMPAPGDIAATKELVGALLTQNGFEFDPAALYIRGEFL